MKRINRFAILIIALLTALMIGCNEDENKAVLEMSQEHQRRMEAQNQRLDEMRQEVAEGSKRLVEADAEARKELVALQRDVQTERIEVGVKRDELENERREITRQRYFDPLIATAITSAGLMIVIALPLVLCWHLLRRPVESADEQAVAELLLEDLVSDRSLILTPSRRLAIEDRPAERSRDTDEHSD